MDDGRTIADMSGVERPAMFGHLPSSLRREKKEAPEPKDSGGEDRPWEDYSMNRRERTGYVLGALGAALCIGLVYIVVLGLVIFLMVKAWT